MEELSLFAGVDPEPASPSAADGLQRELGAADTDIARIRARLDALCESLELQVRVKAAGAKYQQLRRASAS